MKTAVIYARVSSADQRDTGYSIPAQLELFKTYAKQKDLKIVQEYQESESAKAAGRKLFTQMINYVKDNKIEVIVFEKVDRMTRNYADLITIYELMETHNIEVHLIKNSLILDKNSRSQEKFQLDINVVLARNYINNLSEEVKKGMHQKMIAGGWCHKAPLGYSNIKRDGKSFVIPNEDAFLVKKMFTLAFNGYSILRLKEELDKTKKIARSYIHTMLTNPFYIGYMETKEGTFKGSHEPIIDPVTFAGVQKQLKQKDNRITAVERSFRFSGLITCQCGAKLYGEVKKGKYITYGCSSRIYKKPCNAPTKYISETRITEQLDDYLKQISITPEDKIVIDTMLSEMFEQMEKESNRVFDLKNDEIKKIRDKLMRLLDHYDEGLLTKEEYLERKEYLNKQLIKAQAEYDANTTVPLDIRENFKKLFEPIVNLHLYWKKIENYDHLKEIFKNLFTNLYLKDGILHIEATNLGKILYEKGSCPRWLG